LTIALYPGSFDPITNGHLDIARRASCIFERVVVGIYDRPNKKLLFTAEERVKLARKATADFPNISVESYDVLTVNFAQSIGAKVMVRGLRMISDFELEFEMAMMNRKLVPDLELVCLMANLQYQFVSSSLLKEVAELGGDINSWVPENVAKALLAKFGKQK
jgi:pantetheine-phosphate adenylyltransferase